MVIVNCDGRALFEPKTPLQALLLAEAHVRALGYPHLSPLDVIKASQEGETGEIITAGFFSGTKLTLKELLPGLKLRAGASEIEIVRVRPTEREVTYKARGKFIKMDSQRFLELATQQGYRKTWDLKTFLTTLKTLLKPILSAIPLMWVLKLVTNAVRKKPIQFESAIHKENEGRLSSPHHHLDPHHEAHEHEHGHELLHEDEHHAHKMS